MPRMEDIAWKTATWHVVDTTTNAVASATRAAEAGHRHLITGYTISTSETPISSGTCYVKDGDSVLDQVEVNKDAPSPLRSSERWLCAVSNTASIQVSALGAGVLMTIVLHGTTVDR